MGPQVFKLNHHPQPPSKYKGFSGFCQEVYLHKSKINFLHVPGIWDIVGLCLHLVLRPMDSLGPSRRRRNFMSSYRATVCRKSVGSFGWVLRLDAIMRSTKSIRFWMRKNPNLQDPGARAPGQNKKIKKRVRAQARKLSSLTGALGYYKILKKEKK